MIRFPGALALMIGVAAGVGLGPGARAAENAAKAPNNAPPVSISVNAHIDDAGKLQIDGEASVPDGALVAWAAYRVKQSLTRMKGYATVEDHKFHAMVDIRRWAKGKIAVDANFQIMMPGHKQPDHIVELYGKQGEFMTGPHVVHGGGLFRAAVATTSVVKN